MKWTDIRALAISDSLNSGVIFVETSEGSVVVRGYPHVA